MSHVLLPWEVSGLLAMSLLAVGACTTRGEDPLIHDTTYGSFRISDSIVDVFGTNASRRMVIVRNERKKGESGKEKENILTFCAEPPPDVGEAFSAAVAISMQAAVNTSQVAGPEAGAVAAGAFARELATQIAPSCIGRKVSNFTGMLSLASATI